MRKLVKNNVSWVGYMDWELKTFHGDEYSILNGSSQNAFLIEEEKTILVDTVWLPHRDEFIENLKAEGVLDKIDAIIVSRTIQVRCRRCSRRFRARRSTALRHV